MWTDGLIRRTMTSIEYKIYLFIQSETFWTWIAPISMAIIGLGITYIKNGYSLKNEEHLK